MHATLTDGSLCLRAACKMPTIVPEARAALAAGYAVVLGIQSTGEVNESHAKNASCCVFVGNVNVCEPGFGVQLLHLLLCFPQVSWVPAGACVRRPQTP